MTPPRIPARRLALVATCLILLALCCPTGADAFLHARRMAGPLAHPFGHGLGGSHASWFDSPMPSPHAAQRMLHSLLHGEREKPAPAAPTPAAPQPPAPALSPEWQTLQQAVRLLQQQYQLTQTHQQQLETRVRQMERQMDEQRGLILELLQERATLQQQQAQLKAQFERLSTPAPTTPTPAAPRSVPATPAAPVPQTQPAPSPAAAQPSRAAAPQDPLSVLLRDAHQALAEQFRVLQQPRMSSQAQAHTKPQAQPTAPRSQQQQQQQQQQQPPKPQPTAAPQNNNAQARPASAAHPTAKQTQKPAGSTSCSSPSAAPTSRASAPAPSTPSSRPRTPPSSTRPAKVTAATASSSSSKPQPKSQAQRQKKQTAAPTPKKGTEAPATAPVRKTAPKVAPQQTNKQAPPKQPRVEVHRKTQPAPTSTSKPSTAPTQPAPTPASPLATATSSTPATPDSSLSSAASNPDAEPFAMTLELEDSPELVVDNQPRFYDISLRFPRGLSAQYVHAEIRGRQLVLLGERHYEDKLLLLPEEVGRIGQYGLVRRAWKLPGKEVPEAERVDVQMAQAVFDQQEGVIRVRLYKLGAFGPSSVALPEQQIPRIKVQGSTIVIPVEVVGPEPNFERVLLPPLPSPLDAEDDEQVCEAPQSCPLPSHSALQPVPSDAHKVLTSATPAPSATNVGPANDTHVQQEGEIESVVAAGPKAPRVSERAAHGSGVSVSA